MEGSSSAALPWKSADMAVRDTLSGAARLTPVAFLPIRRAGGRLHRRRRFFEEDRQDSLPPLPPPWTDERWFRGGFPPRQHNDLRPLPHGHEYFHDLHATLLKAQER